MSESFEKKIWNTLYPINVNEKVEKKNGLIALSWAWAWGELMKYFPQSSYTINLPTTEGDGSMTVSVTLTIKEGDNQVTRYMWLPVMDFKNHAIKCPNSVDINKATMRCLTKAISMFGLGFYIYAGEDLPEEEKREQKISEEDFNEIRKSLIKALEDEAQKGAEVMSNFWANHLTQEQRKIIGNDEKERIKSLCPVDAEFT